MGGGGGAKGQKLGTLTNERNSVFKSLSLKQAPLDQETLRGWIGNDSYRVREDGVGGGGGAKIECVKHARAFYTYQQ